MKKVTIKFSDEAKKIFLFLEEKSPYSKKERMLFDAIQHKIELIKKDRQYGIPISKGLIPAYYKEKHNASNLFRVELPCFWRMLYTLKEGEQKIEIIAFIIDIINHKKYNKKFGYKKH
ncbi:MAG: hypothetical protein KKF46_03655 [Nanoarchaeota archaeon]|nr:hypothetical protein [Nanoarchaeota archaeon]MBU1321431.1 hypothetical protein [Nanoarchaeota archaeon]MBU1597057.1 hypothetical protein [Nanoarchaeota archaeon]MBU2440847.1 hypothetical protein [Nanoarchaeota archaeon]